MAACPLGIAQTDCERNCNSPNPYPACAAQAEAHLDCSKKATAFTCQNSFGPFPVGCDAESEALATCILGQLGDGGLGASDAPDDSRR